MEFHPTLFVIIGLGCDIVGAVLIVSSLLNFVKRGRGKDMGQDTEWFEPNPLVKDTPYKSQWIEQKRARWGLGFLAFGFFLQMVGNWLQSPPF